MIGLFHKCIIGVNNILTSSSNGIHNITHSLTSLSLLEIKSCLCATVFELDTVELTHTMCQV